MSNVKPLSEFKKGESGTITEIQQLEDPLTQRLMKMGFLKGELIQVLHEAPVSRDPIAVKVRGGLIAIRRSEAKRILISNQ